MVKPGTQYPHTFTLSFNAEEATKDANGNWQQASDNAPEIQYQCRAERASGYVYRSGTDGKTVYFSWLLYMPPMVDNVADGAQVTVKDDKGKVFASGSVLQFIPGTFNARLWL